MSDSSMASRCETIEIPLIGHEFHYFGDRFHILESSRDTNDRSLRGDYFAAPRAKVPEHVHREQEERFEVVSGTLGLRVGGREMTLSPGQSAVGPPGVPHKWWNPSDDEEVHLLVGLHPGRDVETWLETLLGLARDGKTTRTGIPKNPLQLAVLLDELGRWAYVTGVPMPVQKVLLVPLVSLAFVGRLLGYKASYPEYSGLDPSEGNVTDGGQHWAAEPVLAAIGLVLAVALLRRSRAHMHTIKLTINRRRSYCDSSSSVPRLTVGKHGSRSAERVRLVTMKTEGGEPRTSRTASPSLSRRRVRGPALTS